MAIMLIDGTKEEACRTAEANAIRAKTGGSSQLSYDFANSKGFADAIASIPSGGGGESYSGSITPVEDTRLLTIPIDIDITKFRVMLITAEKEYFSNVSAKSIENSRNYVLYSTYFAVRVEEPYISINANRYVFIPNMGKYSNTSGQERDMTRASGVNWDFGTLYDKQTKQFNINSPATNYYFLAGQTYNYTICMG